MWGNYSATKAQRPKETINIKSERRRLRCREEMEQAPEGKDREREEALDAAAAVAG